MAPILVAVLYAYTLLFIFPLLAIPVLVLLYLSFMAMRYMVDRVYINRHGTLHIAQVMLWTLRRFGWILGLQSLLFGLVLLSRDEWAIGGVAIGCSALGAIITELLIRTNRLRPRLPDRLVSDIGAALSQPLERTSASRRSISIDQRLIPLLPGLARLPRTCPIPVTTEYIDDLTHTERAANAQTHQIETPPFHDPTESLRGLVYPPEMVEPVPVIWLGSDERGPALKEANELGTGSGLVVLVDPGRREVYLTQRELGRRYPMDNEGTIS